MGEVPVWWVWLPPWPPPTLAMLCNVMHRLKYKMCRHLSRSNVETENTPKRNFATHMVLICTIYN